MAEGGQSNGLRVDGVGLTLFPGAAPGAGHEAGGNSGHTMAGGEQILFQPAGEVSAVLESDSDIGAAEERRRRDGRGVMALSVAGRGLRSVAEAGLRVDGLKAVADVRWSAKPRSAQHFIQV